MKKMTFEMDGKVVSSMDIDKWELSRLIKEYHFLKKKGFNFSGNFDLYIKNQDLDNARKELAQVKASCNPSIFRRLLKRKYTIGNMGSKIAAAMSRGRKYSITDVVIPYSNKTPEEVLESIENIMLENTTEHLYMNLATNPDHFVLISTVGNVQEIIEYTGGSPFPYHFFAHYGNEEGLLSKLSEGFKVQIAGTAKLKDGTIVGGIRHQIKKEHDGLRFRALVEFPSILPNYMIRKHQYHLACEFRQWLGYVI